MRPKRNITIPFDRSAVLLLWALAACTTQPATTPNQAVSAAPTCADGIKDGSETDVDCGGGTCRPCTGSAACLAASDCQSGQCAAHQCAEPVALSAISPPGGPNSGGTPFTLTGAGFKPGSALSVTIGGAVASGVTWVSPTQIIGIAPPSAGAVGPAAVAVHNPDGQEVQLPGAFAYYYGQDGFSEQVLFGADGPYAVASGDLNGDGKPDLVVTHINTGNIAVALGQGGGTFGTPSYYPAGNQPSFVAITPPLNKNNSGGFPAVLTLNAGDHTMSLLLGDGTGAFHPPATYAVGNAAQVAAVVDVNQDGLPDVVLYNLGSSSLTVYAGNQSGALVAGTPLSLPAAVQLAAVAVADFTGDGLPDLVISDGVTGNLWLWTNSSAAGATPAFTAPALPLATSVHATALAVTDSNRDGNRDLIATQPGPGGLFVVYYQGGGDGTFAAGAGTGAIIPENVTFLSGADPDLKSGLADFNDDGRYDLYAQGQDRAIWPLIAVADGAYALVGPMLGLSSQGGFPLAADINGDGYSDFLVAAQQQNLLRIVLSGSPPTSLNLSAQPQGLVSADFNGDGSQDYAATSATGTVDVFLNAGVAGSFAPVQRYPVGSHPTVVQAGDLTGDGALELMVLNSDPQVVADNTLTLLINQTGTKGYLPGGSFAIGAPATTFVLGDLNHDGAPDAIVATAAGIAVMLGKSGTVSGSAPPAFLPAALAYPTSPAPSALATGDFNHDGNLDVAFAVGGDLAILLGQGDGSFANLVDYTALSKGGVIGLATGDMDGDGRLDLVAAASGGAVWLLHGQGDGTFLPGSAIPLATAPTGVTLGDVNGDGRLDVLLTGSDASIWALLNGVGEGGAGFQAARVATRLVPAAGLVAVDLYGDHKTGLLYFGSSNSEGGATTVSFLRNLSK